MRTLAVHYFKACVAGSSSQSDRRICDRANGSHLLDNQAAVSWWRRLWDLSSRQQCVRGTSTFSETMVYGNDAWEIL